MRNRPREPRVRPPCCGQRQVVTPKMRANIPEPAHPEPKVQRRPRVLRNGNIEFPKRGSPPTLEELNIPGYIQDPTDPYRFIPDGFPPCTKRVAMKMNEQDGRLMVYTTCMHEQCPLYNKRIGPFDCNQCVNRIPE
jgi:hypothetical protein